MKMKTLITSATILLVFRSLSVSQSGEKPKEIISEQKIEKENPAKNQKVIDLVCKMKVAKSSNISVIHNHKEYKFCGESCKNKFVKNPENYIEK
jgi:YHS domain-containing protein